MSVEYTKVSQLPKQSIDLTGKKFERLTVIHPCGVGNDGRIWYCKCDCGGEVYTSGHSLRLGRTRSCGCLGRETRLKNTHENRTCCKDGTNLGNLINPVLKKNNTSGYNGVTIRHYKTCVRYLTSIMFKRKQYHIGSFSTIEEAITARRNAEKALFDPAIHKHFETLSEHLKKDYFKNIMKEETNNEMVRQSTNSN